MDDPRFDAWTRRFGLAEIEDAQTRTDDTSVRHIGPMAREFAATFDAGADDRHIRPLDGQGVALEAIQGLLSQLQDLRDENARLAARLARVESATWSSLLVQTRSSCARYRN